MVRIRQRRVEHSSEPGSHAEPRASPSAQRRLRRQRGAVSVEYLVVVGVVGLSLALTLVTLGPGMVLSWAYSRHVLYGRAP